MSIETENNDDPAVAVELHERFHVCDEGSAIWVLRKIAECRAYRDRVARWAQAETLRAERQEAFLMHRFGNELEAWAREQIGKQHGRRRSIALPAGVLGLRREPTKLLVVDERALVGWCRTHLPGAFTLTGTEGSYAQTAAGTLAVDLVGDHSYDSVNAAGGAVGAITLAGNVNVTPAAGYAPAFGATFPVLAAKTLTPRRGTSRPCRRG